MYLLDTARTLHVLDAATGAAVYDQALVPESERLKTNSSRPDLIQAGGAIYAVNLGSRSRTVLVEPGREFGKRWKYALKEAPAGSPAFELGNHYVCADKAMYCIGGRTPVEPISPRAAALAPVPALNEATDVPSGLFASDIVATNWVVAGPIKPRSLRGRTR